MREAILAKLFSYFLQSHMDYLRGHLRERIAHAKRTGTSTIGQNPHSILTAIEKYMVSYCPEKKTTKKNNTAVQDGGAACSMFINII